MDPENIESACACGSGLPVVLCCAWGPVAAFAEPCMLVGAADALAACDIARAERHARDTIRSNPEDAAAHHMLAMIFTEQMQFAAGEYHYRRAIALSGGDAVQFAHLAWNLSRQGRADEARALYEQSTALDPDVFDSWFGWARMEAAAGDLPRSREWLDRALRLDPSNAGVRLLDAVLRARQGDAPGALSRLQQMADHADRPIAAGAALEQGRLLGRLGRHDEAFAAFDHGKRLLRESGRRYRADIAADQEKRLKDFFVAGRVRLLPGAGLADGPQPLFICGAPCSGMSLLERMLARHAGISAGRELPALAEAIADAPRLLASTLDYPETLAELWMGDRHDALDRLRDAYLRSARRAGAMDADKPFFTDRMPFNETHLGMICLLFPHAPIVHMLRHPLDVVLSVFARDTAHGMDCAVSLETAAREYVRVAGLVEHYRAEMPLRYLSVRYEDVVRDPEPELRRISAFLGLAFDPSCLDFHEDPRPARAATYAQLAQELYGETCNRYRHYCSHLKAVIPILERTINAQGYSIGSWTGQRA
jgi:Tfp pilus assembly protein PilF